ncbi:MAG TPA: histidine phosphatase family protein, partial [Anaerolineales bacterium]|nr:histidine phosphatase family protein [Anaerolineales bacterium]
MTTRLYLIRHGATQLTAENRFSGHVGVELSEEGRMQAAHLAARLADDDVTAVYASPLSRTMDTARIIGQPHGLTPVERDGLREISHGRWEGYTRQEVEALFPGEYPAWEEDPFTFA